MVSENQVREILQGGLGIPSIVNRPEWPTSQDHAQQRHFYGSFLLVLKRGLY
jgi:hypothetical protein